MNRIMHFVYDMNNKKESSVGDEAKHRIIINANKNM